MRNNFLDRIISETINRYINEDHLKVVDNIDEVVRFVADNWESPEDVWWIKIDARFKDAKKNNIRGGTRHVWWTRKERPDSSRRDNHVGYVIVRGRTKEDCANSILNAVVMLHPWAAREYGQRHVRSNGNAEAIKDVCEFFFARSYITINKRNMHNVLDIARYIKVSTISDGREFHRVIGTSRRGGRAGSADYAKKFPLGLIDCDVDDLGAQKELEDYLERNGVKIYMKRQSHDGMHYIVSEKDAKKLKFNFMYKYKSDNRPGDENTKFKPDASIIVYSPIG